MSLLAQVTHKRVKAPASLQPECDVDGLHFPVPWLPTHCAGSAGRDAYGVTCVCLWQIKEAAQQPQMVFTVRHATVTFQTDGDTWREQKERRAALMVGILIGVFVLCWIPFFITELISPLCSCDIPPIWKSIFLWLGYSNSFFNPLIYTAFNKNYNNAFRNLFFRQHWARQVFSAPGGYSQLSVEPNKLLRKLRTTNTAVMLRMRPHGYIPAMVPIPIQLLFFMKQHARVSLANSKEFCLQCPTAFLLPSHWCSWDIEVAVMVQWWLLGKVPLWNSAVAHCWSPGALISFVPCAKLGAFSVRAVGDYGWNLMFLAVCHSFAGRDCQVFVFER